MTKAEQRRSDVSEQSAVRIESWGDGELPLLEKLMGDPAMTEHLGGPESPEKIAERQARYEGLRDPSKGRMFKIIEEATGEAVGSTGYWERIWRDEEIYETGWSVLPEFQGRGFARMGTAQAIGVAAAQKKHHFIYAFPSIENGPSNAICRRLGFTLVEEHEFEYPPGHPMQCNVWRLDLSAA